MAILFAIEEAGTFSYLEPLFKIWLAQERKGWRLYAGEDVQRFPRFTALQSVLLQADDKGTPNLLMTSLGKTSAKMESLYQAAAANNIPRIGILDVWGKVWDAAQFPVTHFFAVDAAQKTMLETAFPSAGSTIIGQPAWESVSALPKASTKKVLFVGQPIRQVYGAALGYDEYSAWDMLKDAVLEDEHTISYALHPAQNEDDVRSHIGKSVEIHTDTIQALQTYGTIISPFSSVLYEAWLGGRRNVISLQPFTKEGDTNKCALSGKGFIPCVSNANELRVSLYRPALPRAENPFQGSLERLENAIEAFRP